MISPPEPAGDGAAGRGREPRRGRVAAPKSPLGAASNDRQPGLQVTEDRLSSACVGASIRGGLFSGRRRDRPPRRAPLRESRRVRKSVRRFLGAGRSCRSGAGPRAHRAAGRRLLCHCRGRSIGCERLQHDAARLGDGSRLRCWRNRFRDCQPHEGRVVTARRRAVRVEMTSNTGFDAAARLVREPWGSNTVPPSPLKQASIGLV